MVPVLAYVHNFSFKYFLHVKYCAVICQDDDAFHNFMLAITLFCEVTGGKGSFLMTKRGFAFA